MADDRDDFGGPDTERHPTFPEEGPPTPRRPPLKRKKTMVGLGAPAPVPPPAASSLQDDDWDDDDMATQVYDKSQHGAGRISSAPPPMPEHVRSSVSPSSGRARVSSVPPPVPADARSSAPPAPDAVPSRYRPTPRATPRSRLSDPAPRRESVPPPRPMRRAGPGPATAPLEESRPSVEVFDEDLAPLRGDPTIQDYPVGAGPQGPTSWREHKRSRERTEVLERPKPQTSRGTIIALVAMGVLMLGGLGLAAWATLGPKKPGTIELTTDPPDATVVLDNEAVAATSSPFVVRGVTPGTVHLIEVRRQGYKPWSMQLDLEPGEVIRVPQVILVPEIPGLPASAAMAPAAAAPAAETSNGTAPAAAISHHAPRPAPAAPAPKATAPAQPAPAPAEQAASAPRPAAPANGIVSVRFRTDPAGARVEIQRGHEKRVVGFAPTLGRMEAKGGPWTVRISNFGYQTWTKKIELPRHQSTYVVHAELTPKTPAPPSSAAPSPPAHRHVRRATHRAAAAPRAQPSEQAAAPSAPASPPAAPAAAPATANGTLRINTKPWTHVIVDDHDVGSTPLMNISLTPGTHTVHLVNLAYQIDKTITVHIEAGKTVTKVLDLTPPAQPAPSE